MARQDLGKIVSEVTSVNVTVDNNVGVPSAEASISGTLTEKELSINFKNLKGEKGDKPTKGTDYYTDQEKQEFITETNALVVAEGKKQVKELQNQGSLSIERLLKIQKEIEAILQNQEAIGNALALNGKSGPQYDKEIRNIAGGEFDPDLLFLNDAGTKTAGKLYYDKNKSGVFKCIQTTTSTVNSTTNFVDVSSLENANKLENLCKINSKTFYCDEMKELKAFCHYNDKIIIIYVINSDLPLASQTGYTISGLPKGYENAYGVISGNGSTTRPIFYSYETGNINIPPSGNSVQPFMSGIIVGLKK